MAQLRSVSARLPLRKKWAVKTKALRKTEMVVARDMYLSWEKARTTGEFAGAIGEAGKRMPADSACAGEGVLGWRGRSPGLAPLRRDSSAASAPRRGSSGSIRRCAGRGCDIRGGWSPGRAGRR